MAQPAGIVTDTVACVPDGLATALGIHVVPVHLLVDDDDFLDGELDHVELQRRIFSGATATTATPPPGDFLAVYHEVAAAGHESAVVLTVSAALSQLHSAARLGASGSPIPVTVIDTRTVASAQGLIVRRLAEMAAAGAGTEEIVAAFETVRERTGLVAMVPDLGRLHETGRVPAVAAALGGRLHLRPLIEIRDDGLAHASGVVRRQSRGVRKMMRRALAMAGVPGSRLVVMHTLAGEEAGTLAASLQARAPGCEVEVAPFTAVMGIHTGPGLLGIAWESAG
jgi:DegV family protein with EDD domain